MSARGMAGMMYVAIVALSAASGSAGVEIDGQVVGVKDAQAFLFAGGRSHTVADAAAMVNHAESVLSAALEEKDSVTGKPRDATALFGALFDALDILDQAMAKPPLETAKVDSAGKFAFTTRAPAYSEVVLTYERCGEMVVERHTIKSDGLGGKVSLGVEVVGEGCAARPGGGLQPVRQ